MDAAEIPGVSGTYRLKGQEKHGGSYSTELAAAKAYDSLVMRHYGEFARLNFPPTRRPGVIIVAKPAEKHGGSTSINPRGSVSYAA